ncbi:unnamed protein product [Symbiodinium microadriaticum]|nr:unnamed protein product [Symbiodinium microadriaticum]
MHPASAATDTSDGSTTNFDDTLMRCIDAKLLDISGQTTALKTLLGSLEAQQTIARLEEIQDALSNHRVTQEQLLESVAAIAPKMKDVQGVAAQLTPMTSVQQSMALDTKKGFAATETHIDGVLKAQQDMLRCLQSETKELKDKLIKIDTVCEGLTGSAKQLSLNVHVSRTKQEQKMDNYIQDYNKFQGATNSSLRALGPVMTAMKTVTDHLNNAMDYLAKAWQSYERTEPVIHNMQEQVNNIEDRLLRIESLVGGNTDTANECSDMIQQLKESQNLLHDNLSQVLERLPKLPKRQPPSQEAPPASTTSQTQVPQQSPGTFPVQTNVDTGIPLRLSDHLMPVQRPQEDLTELWDSLHESHKVRDGKRRLLLTAWTVLNVPQNRELAEELRRDYEFLSADSEGLVTRPDDQLDTSEEPPIELIVTDVPPKQAEPEEPECLVGLLQSMALQDDFANLEYEKPKIEIQPVKKALPSGRGEVPPGVRAMGFLAYAA